MLSQPNNFEPQVASTNRAQLVTWKWKDFSATAYQLPDASYVMSYRQMALKVHQDKNHAKNFVETANFPRIKIEFNQFVWAMAVPLTTVLAYWKHLDESGLEKQTAPLGWMAIEDYLTEQKQPSSEPDSAQPTKTLKAVYELNILPSRPLLRLLILSEEGGYQEYKIDAASALELIGVVPQWLDRLRPKTRIQLSERGFSGMQQTSYIIPADNNAQLDGEETERIASTHTIELSDYLAICQYFAERRASAAIACLAALATESLDSRLAQEELNRINLAVEISSGGSLITQAEKVTQALYQSNHIFQQVIDSIPQYIFWKNRYCVYLGCNRNFARVAGVKTPENILGKTDYDLPWKKEESDWFRECDARIMETNTPEYHIIEPQLQADGKQSWVSTSKIPLHDSKGNVIGVLGIYEDITERRRVEEIWQQLQIELRQLLYSQNYSTPPNSSPR